MKIEDYTHLHTYRYFKILQTQMNIEVDMNWASVVVVIPEVEGLVEMLRLVILLDSLACFCKQLPIIIYPPIYIAHLDVAIWA